jgi:hypothetical protein
MSKATISDIQKTYGEHSARILNQLHAEYEEIAKAKPEPEGTFWDRLNDAQKDQATRDHRLKLASKAREEAKTKYAVAVREYREKLEARKAEAETQLYGHEDPISADVLATATLASDDELKRLANMASKTGNASLKRAALVAGAQRGMGDVLIETFGDEERELFSELAAVPPVEVLDRQTDDVGIDSVVPNVSVNQLMPSANGHT